MERELDEINKALNEASDGFGDAGTTQPGTKYNELVSKELIKRVTAFFVA